METVLENLLGANRLGLPERFATPGSGDSNGSRASCAMPIPYRPSAVRRVSLGLVSPVTRREEVRFGGADACDLKSSSDEQCEEDTHLFLATLNWPSASNHPFAYNPFMLASGVLGVPLALSYLPIKWLSDRASAH
jgi:hypothetical protein